MKPRGGVLSLGRLRGIAIEVHASWLVAFFLAVMIISAEIRAVAGVATAPIAAATALVFFGSILAHELGHSIVAMRLGIPVRSITLFVFGGIARITREPKRPRDELLIAVAGPLVSAVIGVLALGASRIEALPAYVAAPLLWLGRVNVGLAVFNCLPGFPLDGGRMLRAILWHFRRSFTSATVTSARVGSALGWGFVFLGVLGALGGRFDGLWIAFIGWFLAKTAAASATDALLRASAGNAVVADARIVEFPVVPSRLSIEDYVRDVVFVTGRRAHLLSGEEGIHGLVTFERALAIPRREWPVTPVARASIPLGALPVVSLHTPLVEAVEVLGDAPVAAVVDEGGGLHGVIDGNRLYAVLGVRLEAPIEAPAPLPGLAVSRA